MLTQRPAYEHPPDKVDGGLWRRLARLDLIENLFFGAAMVFSFAFAVEMLAQTTPSPASAVYLLAFWAVMAYLALPRLHRVLTALYVPDYFFGRARTGDGLLGDPVNLAFTGTAGQIHSAMRRAGWVAADPVDITSAFRIVGAALARRSYRHAPVSPLFLFGTQQAFAYQQEVEGNPSRRHHVRFWPCPPGWLLPGGHRVDWLAAGTYDRAVGLSLFTFQITHRIDRDIDIERDYIVATLRYEVPEVGVRVIKDFSTGYHSRNGGGDAVVTDGDLPIVDVGRVPAGEPAPAPAPDDLAHEVGRRPFSVVAAFVLSLMTLVASVVLAVGSSVEMVAADPSLRGGTGIDVLDAAIVAVGLLLLVLAWRTYEGGELARIVMLLLVSLTLAGKFVTALSGQRPAASALLATTLDLLLIYALTSLSAREWTRTRRRSAGCAARPAGTATRSRRRRRGGGRH